MSIKKIITKSLNIIFPVKCVCCRKISAKSNGEDILCENCRTVLVEEASFHCRICGNPPCFCDCKKVEHIDKIVFPYFYTSDKLTRAIFAVKKANLYYINEFFAKDMYNSLKLSDKIKIDDIDIITNTPRIKNSIKFYGYNQTEILAKMIAKYTGRIYKPILEASKLYNKEQKTLDKTQRTLNVKNKFAPIKNITKNIDIIKNKNILIIDDIVTTGSTLSECSRIMKNIGANSVYALCAASVLN